MFGGGLAWNQQPLGKSRGPASEQRTSPSSCSLDDNRGHRRRVKIWGQTPDVTSPWGQMVQISGPCRSQLHRHRSRCSLAERYALGGHGGLRGAGKGVCTLGARERFRDLRAKEGHCGGLGCSGLFPEGQHAMSVGGFLMGREESRTLSMQQCGRTRSPPSNNSWPELGTMATQPKSPIPEGQRP